MGIFSLPIKKPPLGLPWTITTNILDPLGVHFFLPETSIDSNAWAKPECSSALKKMLLAQAQMEAM